MLLQQHRLIAWLKINQVVSVNNLAIACFLAAFPLYLYLRAPAASQSNVSQYIGAGKLEISATIKTAKRETKFGYSTTMEVKKVAGKETTGDTLVFMPMHFKSYGIEPGKNVTFLAEITKCTPKSGNDYCEYLKRQGIFSIAKTNKAIAIAGESDIWFNIQQRIVKSQDNALLTSMIIGDKAVAVPEEQLDEFKKSGLMRLLVVDGFKVTIILGFFSALLSRFDSKVKLIVGLGLMVMLVGIAGPQAGVLRATLLGVVALLAESFTVRSRLKPVSVVIALGAAMLVWNPLLIYDLGFQMSFLATIGIITQTDAIAHRLKFLPFLLAEITAVSIAAMLWTMPVQLAAFGTVNPYSLPANIIASPLVAPLTVGAAASAGMAFIPGVGSALSHGSAIVLDPPVQLLLYLAKAVNVLPLSHLEIQLHPAIELIIYLLLFGSICYQPKGIKNRAKT